jgi:hypothetical protein
MAVILKDKGKSFETLYIKGAKVFWANLNSPTRGYDGFNEYQVTVFVNKEDAEKLEIGVGLNKELNEVGVTKIKKGKNRGNIKYPQDKYPGTEGMFGLAVSMPEVSKSGRLNKVIVVDSDKELFTGDIGNGSVASLKLSGYRNKDDALCLTSIQMVMIEELVEYTGGGSSIYDEELGISIDTSKVGDEFEDPDSAFEDDNADVFS